MQTHHEVVRSAKRLIILYLGKHLILTLEVHVSHGSFMIENWRYHDGHLQAQAFIAELTKPTRYHLQDDIRMETHVMSGVPREIACWYEMSHFSGERTLHRASTLWPDRNEGEYRDVERAQV